MSGLSASDWLSAIVNLVGVAAGLGIGSWLIQRHLNRMEREADDLKDLVALLDRFYEQFCNALFLRDAHQRIRGLATVVYTFVWLKAELTDRYNIEDALAEELENLHEIVKMSNDALRQDFNLESAIDIQSQGMDPYLTIRHLLKAWPPRLKKTSQLGEYVIELPDSSMFDENASQKDNDAPVPEKPPTPADTPEPQGT